VKITADTNLLVRAISDDDPIQSPLARSELSSADLVAVTLPTLCELVWVLSRSYGTPSVVIADLLTQLLASGNVVVDRAAAEAGLSLLAAGADFADGVIAYQGAWLGGEAFVSFDQEAVRLLRAQGVAARLPA
jgi:predicted nucleic-acid-binding protein